MIRTRTAATHGGCCGTDRAPSAAFFPRPRCTAFTLIELLVVLAVLSLLLAILSPATKFVYLTGQKVTCQVHLQEMAEAALHFENDRRRLVKIKPSSSKSFTDELKPYLGSHEFFFCPSEKERYNAAKSGNRLDYGINHYGRGDPSHGGKAKFYNTMGYFSNPSKNSPNRSYRVGDATAIYFSDADTDQSPEDIGGISRGTDEWPIQHSFQKYAYRRHLNGYNCAQLDGAAYWYPSQPPTNEKWFVPKY
jgi:prepilin-type N-terminal cleavage/methylation domain-containing protein